MNRDFSGLPGEIFDVIVIGGGINGAGIARDAALRGLKTLLLEKNDFGGGTSSRSSRLIHGGLRYLRHLGFGLVREDLKEREILLRIAPNLVKPLPFLIPVAGASSRMAMLAGMKLYDMLSFNKSLPSARHLSRAAMLEMEPALEMEEMTGAYMYYDCQVSFSERLCLENILSASANGATIFNHARVTDLVKQGNAVRGVEFTDELTGEAHRASGQLIINAAGHWADEIFGLMGRTAKPMLRRTKGIHLITRKLTEKALVLFARSDGRLFFIIPWRDYSLIGTTDTDYSGNLDEVGADFSDVTYLLQETQRVFPGLTLEDVHYTMAGLRSLAAAGGKRASNISRGHRLYDHRKRDRVDGLITLLGGKLTGYRGIAEETVDLVCKKLGVKRFCSTGKTPLPGAPAVPPEEAAGIAASYGVSEQTAANLVALYGSQYRLVMERAAKDEKGKQVICRHTGDILAQVWYAVEEEGAATVADFLLRRGAAGLASCQGLDALETVAAEMGRMLGWKAAERKAQAENYRRLAALGQRYKTNDAV